jgi:ribosome maturation factor RimP
MPSWPIASIRELLEPTLTHMGYEIYAVEQSGNTGRTLRIAIDRPEGISLEDCERVSQVAGPLLDQADLIPGSYSLEVSSPGAERPLRSRGEYERFLGRRVNVRYRVGSAEAVIEGHLAAVDGAGIAVQGKAGLVEHLPWDDILAARLAVEI